MLIKNWASNHPFAYCVAAWAELLFSLIIRWQRIVRFSFDQLWKRADTKQPSGFAAIVLSGAGDQLVPKRKQRMTQTGLF